MQQRNVRLQYSTVVTLLAGVFGGCGGYLIGQLDERTVALLSRRRTVPMFILPINERIFRTTVKIGQTTKPNAALIVDSNGHRGLLLWLVLVAQSTISADSCRKWIDLLQAYQFAMLEELPEPHKSISP